MKDYNRLDIDNDRIESNLKKESMSFLIMCLIAVVFATIVTTYVFKTCKVVGHSMDTTLKEGQIGFCVEFPYKVLNKDYKRKEIVIVNVKDYDGFYSNEDTLLIKRIIGMPGDKIKIKNAKVYINNEPLEEEYVNTQLYNSYVNEKGVIETEIINLTDEEYIAMYNDRYGDIEEIQLKEDEYFVMGDNRLNSSDSRVIGPVKYKDIEGVFKTTIK